MRMQLSLLSFPPYDSAGKCSLKDYFNLYHSSARIIAECAFGDIDLMYVCGGGGSEKLFSYADHNILICERGMNFNNFLVGYFKNLCEGEEGNTIERTMFVNDMCDNSVFNIVVLNDSNRGDGGRPTNK